MTIIRSLLLVALLLLVCLPFSVYSDTITGVSNNAAETSYTWNMDNILPKETGLIVNRVLYSYRVNKITIDDFNVTVSNDNVNGGKIFSETDNWNGLPGNTIRKTVSIPNTPRTSWGNGSIETQGTGEVVEANVRYGYTFDNCIDPLSNPECPQPLESSKILTTEDPYESVKDYLDKETDIKEEDDERKNNDNELDDEDKRRKFARGNNPLIKEAARIASLFEKISQVPQFNNYYNVKIDGKIYSDTVELKDSTLPDNRKALKSLSKDEKFDTIIRSQYER